MMHHAYAILHRLSVEDGYGNTPHVLWTEAPCIEYDTRYYGSQSVCPFFAIDRLGVHLDTPQKLAHAFERLAVILTLQDAVHWHLCWDGGCRVYFGPLLWHSPERPAETGDLHLEIGLLRRERHLPPGTKRKLKRHVLARVTRWVDPHG